MSQMNNVIDILSTALNDLKSQYKAQAVPKQDYDVQEAINKIAPLLDSDTYFNVSCQLNSFSRERPVQIEWNVYIENVPKTFKGVTLAAAVNDALHWLTPPPPVEQPEHPVAAATEALAPLSPLPY
jgi:hypothetical protein